MLFDTHAHLCDERFAEDREDTIRRMIAAGVELCVSIGDGSRVEQPDFELAERYEFIYAATGVHPQDACAYSDEVEARLIDYMSRPKAVALGEIGLDYHYDAPPRDVQRDVFARQLELARKLGKPVIMHIRDAHGDALDILRSHKNALPAGVMHCYSGSWESAREYLDMGFYISFAGAVTFKNAAKLPEVAVKVPSDRILVETDCPYMAPVPKRGRRNEPAFVEHTARLIANLRNVDFEDFAHCTLENGKTLFKIA